jgi:patatin-related protein
MSQQAPPAEAEGGIRPEVDYTQEIRFAVVMYGGSSLAIYMNGVAQELLRLVRATAPALKEDGDGVPRAHLPSSRLEGSTRVYRKLGQLLARGEKTPETDAAVKEDDPLRTRFVIDILTGTSAGGINAVYLAKALANDQPLDELKKLWISEGDVGVLLNDAESDEGLGLGGQKPPGSLLNSRRMYLKLLEALRGMDDARRVGPGEESPLVDELDLFVTATDMNGRVLPLRLADGVAHERRHRNVFRFRYFTERVGGEHRNDFLPAYNPFLAFASRCTSAHQAAFEVMRLADIKPALKLFPAKAAEYGVESEELKEFYREYLPPPGGDDDERAVPFAERSFSDGGVLDNSPFSFASDALPFRHADAPVDRKLIYIEPSPEHPELEQESAERPDFFTNVLMALSTLPRYQTIVEDLMRVLERNRLVERTSHIILGLEDDLKWKRTHRKDYVEPPKLGDLLKSEEKVLEWAARKREDLSWGGYQRLRVAEVTDDLALLVSRAAGFDEESDEFTAIRYLVRDWRDDNFYDSDVAGGKRPQVVFLLLFDMMWLVRRLKFVLTKINEISCFDDRALQVLEAASDETGPGLWEKGAKPGEALRREMRAVLLGIKREVAAAFTSLRVARRTLWSRGEDNDFRPYIAALDIGSEDLLELLKQPTDEARRGHAADLLKGRIGEAARERLRAMPKGKLGESDRDALGKLLNEGGPAATRGEAVAALNAKVEVELGKAMGKARGRCNRALAPAQERAEGDARAEAEGGAPEETGFDALFRDVLWYYYRHFDEYDQVAHPILHATDAGEELDPVEVFRISPEDATFLIDEKKKKVQKLAGTTLGHFGAFFEERFRFNDIMWGRLDAAERVIRALLPNDSHKPLRDELTAEAHRAIIIEETVERRLAPEDKAELNRLVRETLAQSGGDDGAKLAAELAERLKGAGIDPSLKGFLHAFLEKVDPLEKFRQDFHKNYEEERAFTPRDTVVNAGRASRVFGRMVEGIADSRRRRGNKLVLWLTRLTRWAWGLAEVAVPDTIPNLFARHLLRVLYLFEVALIVFGFVFASKELQRFGLAGLALTAGLHVLLLFVGDYVRGGDAGGKKSRRLLKFGLRIAAVFAGAVALALLLSYTNRYWLPYVLDSLIKMLQDWRKGP